MARIATTDTEKLANLIEAHTELTKRYAELHTKYEMIKNTDPLKVIDRMASESHRSAAGRVRSIIAYVRGLS
jgi:hypothetical protein